MSPAVASADLLASFADDGDVAAWINGLLDAARPPRDGHADVSALATRLEVACQDTSSSLEQAIDDISRAVPRLAYDLHFLRESARALSAALAALHARIAAAAADDLTAHALRRLRYLDTVSTRMQAARAVLREAESWSTLESDVTALLAEPHYHRAAERLADASRSMVVFQNTPEYEPRRALMVSLQNQLEAALSAALVAAINARDVAACKSYYAIFAHIQREAEFRNYYNGSRRAALLQLWTAAALSDVDGEPPRADPNAPPPAKFSELLARFFADFLVLVNEERMYAPSIFPDPQQTLSVFVQSTIDALTPSLSQRLAGVSEHYGAAALPEIIKAFRAAEEFAVETDKVLEKVGYATLFSPQTPAPDGARHARRLSKRMSMSRRLGPARASLSIGGNVLTGGGAWEQALLEPFVDFQAEYQALETKHLAAALGAVMDASHRATRQIDADGARAFRERAVDVFALAEDALARCMGFTHGYGAVGLLHALDHVFAAFLDAARAELRASGHAAAAADTPGDAAALEELDYSAGDWRTLQLALHLLDACRAVRERLGVLDAQVRAALGGAALALRRARADPQHLYIPNTTRGAAQLLSQCPLNSAPLQALLDALDPGAAGGGEQPLLLGGARAAAVEYTRACQGVLQDTLLAPLLHHLAAYAASPAWAAAAAAEGGAARAPSIPTFSLSPTPAMQRVAEGLLNLPRLFEVYAEDDALAFSVETLPFVDAASLRAALAPASPVAAPSPDAHARRLSASFPFNAPPPPPQQQQPPQAPQSLPPELTVAAWLSSLALSLLAHLTGAVLPAIRALSARGAAQLASDLAYLSNVVRALNVEWAELELWRDAVEAGEERARAASEEAGAGEEVVRAVARMRGWV